MRKKLLVMMSGIALAVIPSQAQFNTVTTMPNRYKVEVVSSNTDTTAVWYGKTAAAQDTPAGNDTSVSSDNIGKKIWVERYLSVCYPLRHIKINSGYGYRKDPLTGKKKFHNGLDLHARGDEVLAMMEGVVVKVGQDKASGKYVTLQHGGYTVSYCHLSQIRTVKGAAVYPRDIVGITGSTGRSTGEHLHITCKLNGKSVDPLLLLNYIKSTQKECVAALAELQ